MSSPSLSPYLPAVLFLFWGESVGAAGGSQRGRSPHEGGLPREVSGEERTHPRVPDCTTVSCSLSSASTFPTTVLCPQSLEPASPQQASQLLHMAQWPQVPSEIASSLSSESPPRGHLRHFTPAGTVLNTSCVLPPLILEQSSVGLVLLLSPLFRLGG